jgi:hypothetical protein
MSETVTTTAKRPLWRRLLKIAGITAASLVGLFFLVCTLIVCILTPERLTPIVCVQASKQLLADVTIDRVELTFWHTFPELTLDVDSLNVVSRSLDELPDSVKATLPVDADKLLSLKSFHAGVNVFPLLIGKISLYDVVFTTPEVNLVQVNDTVANYLIVPTDTTKIEEESTPLELPSITINRFAIEKAAPLRFRSLPDSLDVSVALATAELTEKDLPRYRLDINGNCNTPLLRQYNFHNLSFGLDGQISWDHNKPLALSLNDFIVALHDYKLNFNTELDFTSLPMVNSFDAKIDGLPVADLLTHLPEDTRALAAPLKTDMKLRATMNLTSPWNVADTVLPSFNATVEVPACAVTYENITMREVAATMAAEIHGNDLNASVVTLKKLHLDGDIAHMDLTAVVTNLMADPHLKGTFNGNVNLATIPPTLKALIPGTVTGQIEGKSNFDFGVGDLSESRFHKIKADGSLKLTNFTADLDTLGRLYTHSTEFVFGSGSSFVKNGHTIDSLLTVSMKSDTIAASMSGMAIECKNLRAGAGTSNRAASADTTMINPFGMTLAFDRMAFDSPADTIRCRLREASVSASLTRYHGNAKLPKIDMSLSLGKLHFGQALNKIALRKANVELSLNMREKKQNNATAEQRAARKARRDSIAAADAAKAGNVAENVTLDKEQRKMLRSWDFSGVIKAKSGKLVTPAFPIKNRFENIDFKFNQDSLELSNLRYKVGQSDFLINGAVTNLRKALTSRKDNTLGMRLLVTSDTINVNEIVDALFAGGAMAQQADSTLVWSEVDSDADIVAPATDSITSGPVLLPRNVDALFAMKANNILYSDLLLHSFHGSLLLSDGVLNLRNLSASTDVGSISVDGLYAGAEADSLRFGLGMKVSDFRLDRLSSVVPAIDSILPAMKSFAGIVNADVALTTDITRQMDVNIPSLKAALNIEGDSLVLIDPDTFKTISKWLMFRHKDRNIIDHMGVEVVVENSTLEVYPFMFDIDRYKLGVMGHNDLAMNLNYHVSVLKSPIPFKFGINVKGTPEKMKIRLGGAKVKDKMVGERQVIASDTRINLVEQINNIFRSSVGKARKGKLNFPSTGRTSGTATLTTDSSGRRHPTSVSVSAPVAPYNGSEEQVSVADSLLMIKQGLIPNPDTTRFPVK